LNTFREKYQEILAEVQNLEIVRTIGELKKTLNGRPLALYGLGLNFNYFWSLCQECGISISCVCDTHKKGVYKDGYPILDMQTLVTSFNDAVVLICAPRFNNEICTDLIQNGFAPQSIIQFPTGPLPMMETPGSFERCLDGYEWAYSFFEDERSRNAILDRVRLRLLGTRPRPNTTFSMYYEDGFISLSQDEIFVDCGVWYGDTVVQFIDKMEAAGKAYKKIYAFEPSESNRVAATKHLSPYINVEIVPKGVWSSETELFFVDSLMGNSSHFASAQFQGEDPKEGHIVPVTSLDLFFDLKGNEKPKDMPTFIKMDIEGSEKEALRGAANIIKLAKPKLAICAYHKIEDIYELPQTILGIRDDYKFALRAHPSGPDYEAAFAPYETILYAI